MAEPAPTPLPPHPTLDRYYTSDATRRRFVDDLFDTTSRHYERVEQILSFGSGVWYRNDALRRGGLQEGMDLLDVASGTGGVVRAAARILGNGEGIVALDASFGMLAQQPGAGRRVQSLGEALPFGDASFDFLSVGYAMRHFADLRPAFSEFRRVLRPGGRLLILEITPPKSRVAFSLLRLYMRGVLPLVARIGTGSPETATLLRYYWDTTAACIPAENVIAALSDAGFQSPARSVTFGIFSDYTAHCPEPLGV